MERGSRGGTTLGRFGWVQTPTIAVGRSSDVAIAGVSGEKAGERSDKSVVPDLPPTGLWIWSFRSAWKRAWMPLQSNTAATRNVFSILPKSGWGMNPWRRNWSPLNLDMRQSWRTSRTGKTQKVLEGEQFQRDFFQILRFLRIHLHWNSWLWAQDLVRMNRIE